MATKRGSKKKKSGSARSRRKAKVIPAETTLKYRVPGDGNDVYIDLMRDIAAVNRRGYHQGQMLQIASIELKQDVSATDPPTEQSGYALQSTIKVLPTTWVAVQAYMKGRMAWMEQQRRTRNETGQVGVRPAYEDFKIYMDAGHRIAGNIRTVDGANNNVALGEWDYSKLVYADQTVDPEVIREPFLHLIGDNVGTPHSDIGLIQAYEESRATVDGDQPNVPVTAADNIYTWLTSSQDEAASAEIVANMLAENDSPPYEIYQYPGGDSNYPTNVDKCYLQTSQSNPVVHSKSFIAMCGLLRVYSQGKNTLDGSSITLPGTLLVHLVPGPTKGILSMNVGDAS